MATGIAPITRLRNPQRAVAAALELVPRVADGPRVRQLTAFCTDGDWPKATLALWDSLRPFVAALTREDPDGDVVCDRVDEACGGVLDFLIRNTLPRAAMPA